MRSICVLLCVVAITAAFSSEFVAFESKFNKTYQSAEERAYRFNVFQETLKRIEKKNANSQNKPFGIGKFSDLTTQEFKDKYLMPKRQAAQIAVDESKLLVPKSASYPSTWDWRDHNVVTKVKNQEQCGSCWAFSATENIESVWIKGGKGNVSSLKLSPQQIVDCDTADQGCNGGDLPTAFEYVIKAGGLESESEYKYTGEDGNCHFKKEKVVAKISNWKYATSKKNESLLVSNLYSWNPLSICVCAETWQDYTSGVIGKNDCCDEMDHCVDLVGYDLVKNPKRYVVRNSWGTDWGMKGYLEVEYGHDVCLIAEEAATSTL